MRLSFHGGAGTVTGSRHLLDTGAAEVLVDADLGEGYDVEEALQGA